MIEENLKLKRYFLGSLDEKQTEEVELRIISDAAFEENLLFAENNLMEEYLDNMLSTADAELFQKNFLLLPERRKQLSNLARIRKYARNKALCKITNESGNISGETFWQWLKKFFFANLRPVNAFAALIIFGLVVGIGWSLLFYNQGANESASLQNEFAALNKTDLSNLAEFNKFSNINLISGVSRGGSSASKNMLVKDNLTANVLLRLALTFDVNPEENFNVEITKDQKNILAIDKVRLYKNPNGQEFRLILPTSSLTKGEYQIKISGQSNADLNLIYSFSVR